jgi:hypothetical protein
LLLSKYGSDAHIREMPVLWCAARRKIKHGRISIISDLTETQNYVKYSGLAVFQVFSQVFALRSANS